MLEAEGRAHEFFGNLEIEIMRPSRVQDIVYYSPRYRYYIPLSLSALKNDLITDMQHRNNCHRYTELNTMKIVVMCYVVRTHAVCVLVGSK